MELEAIENALEVALRLRSPHFPEGTAPRAKIGLLEDYMLKSANVNGELVEARHWLRALIDTLTDQWNAMQGWEEFLRRPRAKATKAEINAAKVQASPAAWDAGRKARRLLQSIDDQITRLEREERVVSRAYTMVTGG